MEDLGAGTSLAALFLAQRRRVGAAKRGMTCEGCPIDAWQAAAQTPSEPRIRVVDHRAPAPEACAASRHGGAA